MKRSFMALAACVAALAVSTGTALAAGPPVQSTTQSTGTDQAAIAASSATQVNPSNQNISVRVLSPGDDGAVSQTNSAVSTATAANTANTNQTANQTQSGSGCGCVSPLQQILQNTGTGQLGGALSAAGQLGAQNSAAPSSVASGSTAAPSATTSQSNGAGSTGTAQNTAPTTQGSSETQGGTGVQTTQQQAQTDQSALAESSAQQVDPSNSNISVRVLSPGNDGSVSQQNNATSAATATNIAPTTQTGTQTQSGSGSGVQFADQDSKTQQGAIAASSADQVDPSNSNISVRVLSPGGNGDVKQANNATSTATATNYAPVMQTVTQDPTGSSSCGCGGSSDVQAAIQQSTIGQLAGAESSTTQTGASNSNDPVRIASFGGGGSVDQQNNDTSTATATNIAPVSQTGTQDLSDGPTPLCGCNGGSDPSVQALGQSSVVGQGAIAASSATQTGASNSNDPVRVWSKGDDGSVSQQNNATSNATATNVAPVIQTATQDPTGSRCGCGGLGVQALGQESFTGQLAGAASSATQTGASNSNDPIRVSSSGDGGKVDQQNNAGSVANAINGATTTQTGNQIQSGSGIQALGQKAVTLQGAFAFSSATQAPGERTCGCSGGSFGNSNGPIRIGSKGDDGSVSQQNNAGSMANASNGAVTWQTGTQVQSGSSCGCGSGIQALGQEAFTGQLSTALSSTWQTGAKNTVAPVRIESRSGGGSTGQSNNAQSTATSPNIAVGGQAALQIGAPSIV
jgi:hypothetical protein